MKQLDHAGPAQEVRRASRYHAPGTNDWTMLDHPRGYMFYFDSSSQIEGYQWAGGRWQASASHVHILRSLQKTRVCILGYRSNERVWTSTRSAAPRAIGRELLSIRVAKSP